MPRENIHYGGWEHRDVHNLNGMLYVRILFVVIRYTDANIVQPHLPSHSRKNRHS